ncbi:response regulator [Aureimonas endophytica]|uniref:Response regulator n=1 Tax=Aureimonas endophytica TaxID=2027858 RepID=A0A916ZZJ5_9HYPH|nr:response regulator [Aureimonas endophytica]GGE20174.1 response regulator [Aureimonas endophytica]
MPLQGKRVLIVEDEMLVAMNLEDTLTDLGLHVAGTAMQLGPALELARDSAIDVAVLDINLHGGRSYPVADILLQRGVPFVFATGYGHTEGETAYERIPVVTKPYRTIDLETALIAALARVPFV